MSDLNIEEIEKKVLIVQKEWADNIISIGKAFIENRDYLDLTDKFLEKFLLFD